MKKLIFTGLIAALLLACAACAGGQALPEEEPPAAQSGGGEVSEQSAGASASAPDGAARAIIVYFSRSGNTEAVAREIQRQTGAEMFALEPENPYPDDYSELLELARQQKQDNARPSLAETPDLDGCATVYIGYPIWHGDMPMVLYSFLESCDLSGKTIAPFCTSGGSGLSGTDEAIRAQAADAEVTAGLHGPGADAAGAEAAVAEWLAGIGAESPAA